VLFLIRNVPAATEFYTQGLGLQVRVLSQVQRLLAQDWQSSHAGD
jgi:hypothetical protein